MALSLSNPNPNIRIVDFIPPASSAETGQNSEPSLAVDPLDPSNLIAGVFNPVTTLFFFSTNGGATWSAYGTLDTNDKSMAWAADGSAALTATLNFNSDISLYSGTASGNFGPAIFTYNGTNNTNDIDQPWIRTGPSNHVYIAYNDLGATDGKTASVLVSADGGSNFTPVPLDRVGSPPSAGQDAPSVRLAVDGSTVYAAFTRWTSFAGIDSSGNDFYGAQVVVVRSDDGGADGFNELGVNGNGVSVSGPITSVFSNRDNSSITLGQERTGGDLAIAVDPNNSQHVVVAYGSAGAIGSGQLQLSVADSTDGGATWSTKLTTAYTTPAGTRSAQPALAISADGTIGLLYDNYNPTTNNLSQHFLITTNDFVTATDWTLAVERNASPTIKYDPYLGDFFDLTCVGNTFYGTFCASNADNGTNALFNNVSFLRNYAGTPGTSSFSLRNASGNVVSSSIDPFFFSFDHTASGLAVSSVSATPAAGDYGVGSQITIAVAFSESAIVTGAPTLTLNDNGVASYVSGSGTNTLTFTYTVGSSDLSETALAVTGIKLPTGTTVQDGSGNNADFSALPTIFIGLQTDSSAPTVTNVVATPPSGIITAGSDVTITLHISEPVTVTNNPLLTLSDGATASYVSGSGSNTLVFDYHVGSESTSDLKITGIDQSGGTITDLAGNPLSSTLAFDSTLQVNVFTWAHPLPGDFDDAASWTPSGGPPGAGSTTLITTSGTYTVTSAGQNNSVGVLKIATGATLDITNHEFDVTAGTGGGALAGRIAIEDAAKLRLGTAATSTTFNNTGRITLNSSGDATDLAIAGAVTLFGTGKVILGDNANNGIVSDGGAATLTIGNATAGNTISGAGTIGDANLTLSNQARGIINGNGLNNALMLDTGAIINLNMLEGTTAKGLVIASNVANFKLIEALGTNARVDLVGATITNATATAMVLASGSGAHVDLDGATIAGGTLKASGTGAAIDVIGASSLDGSGTPVNNAAIVNVTDGNSLTLKGSLNNTGTINLNASGDATDLAISGAVTLTGAGKIKLVGSDAHIVSDGNDATLINGNTTAGNTISGIGTIGDDFLGVTNAVRGIINANDPAGGILSIDAKSFTNAGLLEATTNGVLQLESGITSTGRVKAAAAGAHINLDDGTITGGTVSTIAGSFLDSIGGSSAINTTTAIANAGRLGAEGGDLTITGAVNNTGTLAAANGSHLDIMGAVTGTGSATIASGGTLEFGGAASAKVTFLDGSGMLQLDAATDAAFKFNGTVTGFVHGTSIDLGAINYTTGDTQLGFVENSAHTSGILTVTDGSHTESLILMGDHTLADFTTQQDANHHVWILHT